MMRRFWQLSFCLILLLMTQPADAQQAQPNPEKVAQQDQHFNMVIQGNNRFALSLLKQLHSQYKGNFICSPYSIASGLARISIGAKRETANEIQKAVGYSSSFVPLIGSLDQFFTAQPRKKNDTQLFLASAVWIQEDISLVNAYQYALKRDFEAETKQVDFKREFVNTIKQINEWTSTHTNNHVHQMVGSQDLSDDTQLLLTTAFYAKGTWAHLFPLKQTTRKPFHINERQVRQVEMMRTTAQYPLLLQDTFTLIEIPYAQQEGSELILSLMIFLPKEKMGWQTLLQEMTIENVRAWMDGVRLQNVALELPRFRIDSKMVLDSVLQGMGIKQLFSQKADLSGISEKEGLQLNRAVHKTLFRITEEGSDSNARSTSSVDAQPAGQGNPVELLIDHPFFFMLVERNTQSILGMGRILQP